MRNKLGIQKIAGLIKRPSFTSRDAAALGVKSAMLAYYVKVGELIRIGHGIYRGTNAPVTDEFRWEDLIEAVQRTKGGVICLISALALYELTDEIPRQHWIAIDHKTRHRSSSSTKVIRMRNLSLGKITKNVGGISVAIFDRERTIVDAFKYLSRETAIKALKRAVAKKGNEKLNLKKLNLYSQQLKVDIHPYVMAVTT